MSGAVENCPFCGSDEAGLFRPSDYRTGANNRDWYVQCFGCHVETAEYLTEAEAVIAWNTRTTPPARSYADEIDKFRPQMDDCENALRPGLTWLEGWYDVEGFVAAIRLLSQEPHT